MKIYLLRFDDWRVAFYSEGPEDSRPEPTGLKGWFARRTAALMAFFERAEGRVARTLWRLWVWLQRFVAVDEVLLRGLRLVPAVTLHHPASMPEDEVRRTWDAYLAGRMKHHVFWLVVDALLLPLAICLGPLPGPNVPAYWLTYRVACHAMATIGVRRARKGRVALVLRPDSILEAPVPEAWPQWMRTIATEYGLEGLVEGFERIRHGWEGDPRAS